MTVQKLTVTVDEFGDQVETWTDRYTSVWCQVLPIGTSASGGGEYSDDDQTTATTKYEFVSRYLYNVEYTDRIIWSGGTFDIYQIFPVGTREGMRIRAEWSDNQGETFSVGGESESFNEIVAGTGLTLQELIDGKADAELAETEAIAARDAALNAQAAAEAAQLAAEQSLDACETDKAAAEVAQASAEAAQAAAEAARDAALLAQDAAELAQASAEADRDVAQAAVASAQAAQAAAEAAEAQAVADKNAAEAARDAAITAQGVAENNEANAVAALATAEAQRDAALQAEIAAQTAENAAVAAKQAAEQAQATAEAAQATAEAAQAVAEQAVADVEAAAGISISGVKDEYDNNDTPYTFTQLVDNFNTYGIGQLGVLDKNTGADAAFSLRQLSHLYDGPCVQVRNEAGALLNVGFAFGRVDTYIIEQHANGGDVTVVKWFDQSGFGRHAQSTFNGPLIAENGVVLTYNGLPTIRHDESTTDPLSTPELPLNLDGEFFTQSTYAPLQDGGTGTVAASFDGTPEDVAVFAQIININGAVPRFAARYISDASGDEKTLQGIDGAILPQTGEMVMQATSSDDGVQDMKVNGLLLDSKAIATVREGVDNLYIGADDGANTNGFGGYISEVIHYNNGVAEANRDALEADTMTYYNLGAYASKLIDDTPGAVAAFSLRQVTNSYDGPLIEAFRASDFATQDIGFTDQRELDIDALLAFAQGGDVGVSIWYDQSGLGNHANAAPASNHKPLIVVDGELVTENGKPVMWFKDQNMKFEDVMTMDNMPIYGNVVYQHDVHPNSDSSNDSRRSLFGLQGTGTQQYHTFELSAWEGTQTRFFSSEASSDTAYETSNIVGSGSVNNPFLKSTSVSLTAGDADGFYNGQQHLEDPAMTHLESGLLQIGRGRAGQVKMAELLLYPDAKTAERAGVEDTQMEYYQIGQYQQRFLQEHSGAAMAYSLRRLNSEYTGEAIQIYLPAHGTYFDISFLDDDTLNVQNLLSTAAGGDAQVAVWYDQSGNGLDAVQTDPAKMPHIVVAGELVTENGLPAVKFDGADDGFDLDNSGLDIGNMSSYTVGAFNVVEGVSDMMLALSGTTDNKRWYAPYMQGGNFNYGYASQSGAIQVPGDDQIHLHSLIAGDTLGAVEAHKDGISMGTYATLSTGNSSTVATQDGIGTIASSFHGDMQLQEIVVFAEDKSATNAAITDNIMEHYGLGEYALPLEVHEDATMAYSLRKLRHNYDGYAIKAYHEGGYGKWIGFDANGDLDIATLQEFAGSGSVTVSIWADQSGNGNDLVQTDATLQGLIVQNGNLFTDSNGRPYVNCMEAAYYSPVDVDMPFTAATALNHTNGYGRILLRQRLLVASQPLQPLRK